MNTTKHTPGPWTIHNNLGRKGELGIMADTAPCIIAIMGNQKAWPVEAMANAQLIAAAPELLEAIQSILRTFQLPSAWPEELTEIQYLRCKRSEVVEIAQAAIAKAKGDA